VLFAEEEAVGRGGLVLVGRSGITNIESGVQSSNANLSQSLTAVGTVIPVMIAPIHVKSIETAEAHYCAHALPSSMLHGN
jgi:hypothetical protein